MLSLLKVLSFILYRPHKFYALISTLFFFLLSQVHDKFYKSSILWSVFSVILSSSLSSLSMQQRYRLNLPKKILWLWNFVITRYHKLNWLHYNSIIPDLAKETDDFGMLSTYELIWSVSSVRERDNLKCLMYVINIVILSFS